MKNNFRLRYIQFFMGLLLICLFIMVVPRIYRLSAAYQVFEEKVEMNGIEVDALFYTEEKSTLSAEIKMQSGLKNEPAE